MFKDADRLEQPQRPQSVGVRRVLRRFETHLHMALGRKVVDFGGLDVLDQANEVGGVGEIAVVEKKAQLFLVGIDIKMIDPAGIERGRTALDAVNLIALAQPGTRRERRHPGPWRR